MRYYHSFLNISTLHRKRTVTMAVMHFFVLLFICNGISAQSLVYSTPQINDDGGYCYTRQMPAGCYFIENVYSSLNKTECTNLDSSLAGIIGLARTICPGSSVFRSHQTFTEMVSTLMNTIRNDPANGCMEADLKLGGPFGVLRQKCPESSMFRRCNHVPDPQTRTQQHVDVSGRTLHRAGSRME